MLKVLLRARKRFARNQRGNVGILFAFAAVPMIALAGGAVDLTRFNRHKTQTMNAMDSAAIALARTGAKNDAAASEFVNNYVAALLPTSRDPQLHLDPFKARKIQGGWRVSASGDMGTAFLPVVGINQMQLDLSIEVNSGGNYEIALVLDNTGSMAQRDKIGALKTATTDLLDTLYDNVDTGSRVKTALVPFVTAVNVKGDAFQDSWIDHAGAGKHALDNFDRRVDRTKLFQQIGTAWKGCVEAREAKYDLTDDAPDSPQTQFTPYLWPDDVDTGDLDRNEIDHRYSGSNNYLRDDIVGDFRAHLRNASKYKAKNKRPGTFDEDYGPNKSCAGPIVELTKDRARMDAAVKAMAPHGGSGTNVAQGMIWGSRVLSPGEPFTQGVAYDKADTVKAMVVLTDGKNEIFGDYTGYGHIADNRLGRTPAEALAQANRNVETVCKQVRNKEDLDDHASPDRVRLYMILFQVNDPATQRIFERCASQNERGETLYYLAPDNATLQQVFADIGQDLTTVHLSR